MDSDVWRSRCVRKKKGEMKWQGISGGDDHEMFSSPSTIECIILFSCTVAWEEVAGNKWLYIMCWLHKRKGGSVVDKCLCAFIIAYACS